MLWLVLVFGIGGGLWKYLCYKHQQLRTRVFEKKTKRILLNSVSKYFRSQTLGSISDGQTPELAPALW